MDFIFELRIHKNFAILPVSAISGISGTFARTYPITLKLNQNIEDFILIKNHEQIGNIYGHLENIDLINYNHKDLTSNIPYGYDKLCRGRLLAVRSIWSDRCHPGNQYNPDSLDLSADNDIHNGRSVLSE